MRPLGVTLSAYFQFVRAALMATFAFGVRFVGGLASRLAALAAEGILCSGSFRASGILSPCF